MERRGTTKEPFMQVCPSPNQTAAEHLKSKIGRFIILNVMKDGSDTSICVNITNGGAAAWRQTTKNQSTPLNLESPGFEFTDRTVMLSFHQVNALANNFHHIREIIPPAAVGQNGNVAVGVLPRDSSDMGILLAKLEGQTQSILSICKALTLALDTSIFTMRRELGVRVNLMCGNALSDYSQKLLSSFCESLETYRLLPELAGFGTDNERGKERPERRDALLRWYMQHNSVNPLGTTSQLNFVHYELKPLNISDDLKWSSCADPRTDSVDLLLRLEEAPVFTEVKMRGDKLTSSAVVQVLYYASVLANKQQLSRLRRAFDSITSDDIWLCLVIEDRSSSEANAFNIDLEQTLAFLRHAKTRDTLAPHCAGCLIIIIDEEQQPFWTSPEKVYSDTLGQVG